jgi:hypothetical protein
VSWYDWLCDRWLVGVPTLELCDDVRLLARFRIFGISSDELRMLLMSCASAVAEANHVSDRNEERK